MDNLILTPAYGRDYKSTKALMSDFHNNKDFIINNCIGTHSLYFNKPINKKQIDDNTEVKFRYNNLRKVHIHMHKVIKDAIP